MKETQDKMQELACRLEAFNAMTKEMRMRCDGQVESLNEASKALDAFLASLRKAELNILVAGSFNTGKSSFINALLRKKLLAESVVPCTSVRTVIRRGARRETVLIHRKDAVEEMSLDSFLSDMRYSAQDENEQMRFGRVARFEDIDYAEVIDDIPLLPSGFQIMDTPGLEDKSSATLMTLEAWEKSAVVIYVCSNRGLSQKDREILAENVSEGGKNLFVVINKCDQILDRDELAKLKKKVYFDLECIYKNEDGSVNEKLMQKRIFFVSSLKVLNEEPGASHSACAGFPLFEQALEDFLSSSECTEAVRAACSLRVQGVQKATEDVFSYLNSLYGPIGQIDKQIKTSQEKKEHLQHTMDSIHNSFVAFKSMFGEHVVSLYKDSFKACGGSWEVDLPQLQSKVSLGVGNYTAILRAALNPFIDKKEREQKIAVVLKPFGEVIGNYLSEDLARRFFSNCTVLEKDIEDFEKKMHIPKGELAAEIVSWTSQEVGTHTRQHSFLSGETMANLNAMITRDIVAILLVGVAFGGIGLIVMAVINWSANRKRDSRVEGILTTAKDSALQHIQTHAEATISSLKGQYDKAISSFEKKFLQKFEKEMIQCVSILHELKKERTRLQADVDVKCALIKRDVHVIRDFKVMG